MQLLDGLYGRYQAADHALSRGGIGSVYPMSDGRLVYKEYHSPDKAPSRSSLEHLVLLGRSILVARRQVVCETPESSINWPIDIVRDGGGRTKGVILPAIPLLLFNQFGKPRGLEFLIMRRAAPPPANPRVFLLLRMAEILAYLDSQHLVHGDVNGKNLAWSASAPPCMYLIDCDGMVDQTPPPPVGVHALGWADPRLLDRIIPAHDHLSDRYALALAMYRGLLLVPGNLHSKNPDGTWPAPSAVPNGLDVGIAELLHRALDDPLDGARRPSPAEWVAALLNAYLPGGWYNDAALRHLDALCNYPPMAFVPLPPVTPTSPTGPTGPAPSGRPRPEVGEWFARTALAGGVFWHVAMVSLMLCCPPVVTVYAVISAAYVAGTPRSVPGRKAALIICTLYATLSALWLTFVILRPNPE